ncbi:hypothetical protein [Argonema galeatum]|uniref:hypothetical protein n=1 Tax=Argonema galeatum TaxID=2942762 RepID=UPI002010E3A1|nr:hypothetical protein [Argonema galeatum]MCL1467189.1 hypothetical protein [Argonema galeatum A003/A1]
MTIPSELNALIERLNQELDIIEREATAGLNLVRVRLERFPNNFLLIQMFASFNTALFFVATQRRQIEARIEDLSRKVTTNEQIQEAGEDLAIELGRVLETKIMVKGIKARLENLQ